MANKAYISKVQLPSSSTYYIKDAEGRDIICSQKLVKGSTYTAGQYVLAPASDDDSTWKLYKVTSDFPASSEYGASESALTETTVAEALKAIKDSVIGGIKWIGETTTELTDGCTTATITMKDGTTKTLTEADNGSVVAYTNPTTGQTQQFIWNGTSWDLYGSAGALGALAYKDGVTVKYDKPLTASVVINKYDATNVTIKAVATDAEVAVDGTADVVAGYNNTKAEEFVKEYAGEKQNLELVEINEAGADTEASKINSVIDGEASKVVVDASKAKTASKVAVVEDAATASKAEAGEVKTVATLKEDKTTVATGELTDLESGDTDENALIASIDITNEVLTFGRKKIKTTSIQEADASVEIQTYDFSDVSIQRVSASDVSIEQYSINDVSVMTIDYDDVSVAGAGSKKSVASGSVSAAGKGGAILIGLGDATKGSAIVELGDASMETVATGVKVSKQATVTLEEGEGGITVLNGLVPSTESVDASISTEQADAVVAYIDK